MPLEPIHLSLLVLVAASGFVIFVFMPSIVEMLKPRDRGPRRLLRKSLRETIKRSTRMTHQRDSVPPAGTETPSNLMSILEKSNVRSRRIGENAVRILSDFSFQSEVEVQENIVAEGTLSIGDKCVFCGSVKAYGNISVGNRVIVKGNLISKRNVDIKEEAVIVGSVHADGWVRLGENVFIGRAVVADGDVEMYDNSEVRKGIITNGVKVVRYPHLDFPSTIDKID